MALKAKAITVTLTALDATTGTRKVGLSDIGVYLIKDGVGAARNDATAITEVSSGLAPGEYKVVLNTTDMNASAITVTATSSTANVEIIPLKIVTEQGYLDVPVTSRAASAVWTPTLAGYLTGPVALEATSQTITGTLIKLDAPITSRALSGTALSSAQWTNALTGIINTNLDTKVSSRTACAIWTDLKATYMDVPLTSRALSGTALLNTDWTAARATNLDAPITSRALSGTALSNLQWTNALTGLINLNLDTTISSRATATGLAMVSGGISSLHGNVDVKVSSRTACAIWTDTKATYIDVPITSRTASATWTDTKATFLTGPVALEATNQTITGTQQTILTAVGNIGTAGGAALNKEAGTCNATGGISGVTSGTIMLGSQGATTFENTDNINSVYHTITSTGASGDIVYQFLCGGGTSPVEAIWVGYVQSNNDTINIAAWRHDTNSWEDLRVIVGTTLATIQTFNVTLYSRHMGTSNGELGKVYIRLYTVTGTSPTIATDQIKVAYAVTSRTVGYADGAVWIDTNMGTAGTELFVNGTADNPCLTLADALVIATSLGTSKFRVSNNSTITFTSAITTKTFVGSNWHLILGSQDLTHSVVEGAYVSGIALATDAIEFIDCHFSTATIPPASLIMCVLTSNTSGGVTCAASGDYYFLNCYSGIAGNARPTITFAPSANINLRNYSGGITLENMGAGSNASVEGRGNLVISASCSAGNVVVRGLFSLTNSSISPFVTVTDTARFATDQSLKLTSDYEAAKTAAPSGTALSNLQWTNALTGIINTNLDATVSSRTACAIWTDTKATYVDVPLTSRALSGTALLNTDWTAAKSNYLDAPISSRALSGTALSDAVWTDAKAAFLDALITSRMSSGATVAVAITPEDISAIVSALVSGLAGGGSVPWTYTAYSDVGLTVPLAGVKVWLTTDLAGAAVVSPAQYTDDFGATNWLLDPGTYYVWRSKPGYVFTNPDTEVVV